MNPLVDIEALQDFIDESNESLQEVENNFIELEKDPSNIEIIDRIFRSVHSIKGTSGFFGLVNINKFAHRLENLLDFVRKGEIIASKKIVDVLLKGIDFLQQMLDRALNDPDDVVLRPDEEQFITTLEDTKPDDSSGSVQSVVDLAEYLNEALDAGINFTEHSLIVTLLSSIEKSNKEIREIVKTAKLKAEGSLSASPALPVAVGAEKLGEILVEQNVIDTYQLDQALGKQQKLGEILVTDGVIEKNDLAQALHIQDKRALSAVANKYDNNAEEPTKTIRINQAKLDTFAHFVGELFINIDTFNYLKKELEHTNADFDLLSKFTNTVTAFDEMVENLHESVMEIRRVPAKNLFQRFPKVIRQLSNSIGKKIKFSITGEDTVIDKDLLEKIENPLVHILRNSVDHGIEMPDDRLKNNKPEEGTLNLEASADENSIFITITDDGKGIDPLVMKKVALKKGAISEAEASNLSDQELINLIFTAGVSSAQKVSDISGRGVGMDAVLSGVRECKGTINVTSKINEGAKVAIQIPFTKTLVTKEAMIIESSTHIFALDSDTISTTIEANRQLIDLFAKDKCINHNGKVLHVISVDSFFFGNKKAKENSSRKENQILVICEKYKIALLADKVVSHQKIVVKDFSGNYQHLKSIKGVRGYTILGDENIALIMDIKKIAEHVMTGDT